VTIRYVDVKNENNDSEMFEQFMGFMSVDDSNGKGSQMLYWNSWRRINLS
jgi:hypothetical protein